MYSLIKKIIICLVSCFCCFLFGCSADNDQIINYDNSVVCGENYIAYITDNGNLFMIDQDGADYVIDTGNLKKIQNGMAFSNIIVMLYEDGTMNIFDTYSKSILSNAEIESENYQHFYPAFELIAKAEGIEDFYYIYPEALLLFKNEKWYMGDNEHNKEICTQLNHLRIKEISVIPNYYNFPVLDKKGNVLLMGNDVMLDEYSKAMDWHNITDIDTCENTIIGLDKSGHVKTTYVNGTYAGKVPNWENIRMVIAENEFIAALTNDGKVVVSEGFQANAELQNVKEWENIIYISSAYNYILGVDGKGQLCVSKPMLQKMIDNNDYPPIRYSIGDK